jgi:hypothetical protein
MNKGQTQMSSRADVAGRRWGISARAVRAASIFASILVAGAVSATHSAVAATALFVGGVAEPMLYEPMMSAALGEMFNGTDLTSDTPWVRKSVPWPAQTAPFFGFTSLGDSVSQGRTNLIADIAAAQRDGNGPVTVVGASAGSLVVDETLRYYQEHPDQAPDPKDVNFIVIADGSRQDAFRPGQLLDTLSGYTYQSPPQTPYHVSVVTYQYDGFADFPDRPLNLLADLNALAGMLLLHNATYFADISTMTPTSVVTDPVTKGTTTRYLIAPGQLPLVSLLPFLAPMQDQLKQIIDTGYSRNDPVATSAPVALARSRENPVVAPAKAAPTDAPTTLRAPQAGAEDTQTQTNQTVADVPKTVEQRVTQVRDVPPATVSKSTTGDTAPATSAPSKPEAPTANPVRDADETTTTTTTTANANANTNTNTTHTNTADETKRPRKSATDRVRPGADTAASTSDTGTADSDTPTKHRTAAAKDERPNRHTTAESGDDSPHSAAESGDGK